MVVVPLLRSSTQSSPLPSISLMTRLLAVAAGVKAQPLTSLAVSPLLSTGLVSPAVSLPASLPEVSAMVVSEEPVSLKVSVAALLLLELEQLAKPAQSRLAETRAVIRESKRSIRHHGHGNELPASFLITLCVARVQPLPRLGDRQPHPLPLRRCSPPRAVPFLGPHARPHMLDIPSIAKVELHRHLEGSLRLATVREIVDQLQLPEAALSLAQLAARAQVLEPMESLDAVLGAFDVFQRCFASLELVERLAFEAVQDAGRDHVRLLELRFSPDFMTRTANLAWDEAMAALLRGVRRAEAECDVAVGLIAIASRGYGLQSALQTADFAVRWRRELVGFDLADNEVRYASAEFAPAVARVRAVGLPLTVHSGESTGPEHVLDTLDALAPQRIGHGVAVGRDADLAERMRRERVTIEACPTSNVRTCAVPSFAEHPARRLLRAGVPLALCSDDPGLFAITLSDELAVARRELGFTDSDLARATLNALAASFLPAAQVKALQRRHFGWAEALAR